MDRDRVRIEDTPEGKFMVQEIDPKLISLIVGVRGTGLMIEETIRRAWGELIRKFKKQGYDCLIAPILNNPALVYITCDIPGVRIYRGGEEVKDLEALKKELEPEIGPYLTHEDYSCTPSLLWRFSASIPLNDAPKLPFVLVYYDETGKIIRMSRAPEDLGGEVPNLKVARTWAPVDAYTDVETRVVEVRDGIVVAMKEVKR